MRQVLARAFRRNSDWRSHRPATLALGAVALVLFVAGLVIPSPPVVPCCAVGSGPWAKAIMSRVFLGTLAGWLLLTALRLRSTGREPGAAKHSTI